MKSRKRTWIAALCLLSVTVITISLKARSGSVLAAQHPASQLSMAPPATYISNPSIRAAAIADATLMAGDESSAQHVAAALMPEANPYLPAVEEFALTPPNPALDINQTTLAVRFQESVVAKLGSQIPMTLGGQRVVLRRSADDKTVFSTQVDFDWAAFVKQQQHRKELASLGTVVPVYKGRIFVGKQKMQFLDPAKIEAAGQAHQTVRFSPQILAGGDLVTVVPSHELMIIDPHVVEDGSRESQGGGQLGRTYDACLSVPGNPAGAWTFKKLWMSVINTTSVSVAEQALQAFLANWQNNQTINTNFVVIPRNSSSDPSLGMSALLQNWPKDPVPNNNCAGGHCPSLEAPLRLNAIVNRIDLSGQPNQTAGGELRFVFGITAGVGAQGQCFADHSNGQTLFNIIFEFHVPRSFTLSQWAAAWDSLPKDNFDYENCPADGCYIPLLESTITDNVAQATSCTDPNGNPNTCLFHIRTNEFELRDENLQNGNFWEQREFYIQRYGPPNILAEKDVAQTPDGSFNTAGQLNPGNQPQCQGNFTVVNGNLVPPQCSSLSPATLATYISAFQSQIVETQGTLLVPDDYPSGQPFLGGSAFNGFNNVGLSNGFWNATGISGNEATARRFFSLNTCQGCHGAETNTQEFQQVVNRKAGNPSSLSAFLLGCVPSGGGSCSTSGNPGGDGCLPGSIAECQLDTPGQELVPDPSRLSPTGYAFGDIARRMVNLQTILSSPNQLFLPFMRTNIGIH
ncbi:MAG: hypothetical protein WAL85_11170 [Candidatus Korobacteraceae bacterium]